MFGIGDCFGQIYFMLEIRDYYYLISRMIHGSNKDLPPLQIVGSQPHDSAENIIYRAA